MGTPIDIRGLYYLSKSFSGWDVNGKTILVSPNRKYPRLTEGLETLSKNYQLEKSDWKCAYQLRTLYVVTQLSSRLSE